ncbi:MAG TPA: helix-turn-helix domain-containing protein [Spirochaetia bacterium]|nr:helix-turn-helix domain-containing protein [Spirochaetia bacterium]
MTHIDTTKQWCYNGIVNEKSIQFLMAVGLNRYEAAVYVSLLERGDYAPASLAQRARIPRQRIYDVLTSLEEKGFCTVKSTRPRLYGSVDPAVALRHHLKSKDRELHDELARIESQVAETIDALAPIYREGQRESDPFQYLEVLRTSNSIARRSLELAAAATSHANSFVKLPLVLSREQNIQFIHEPLKRGLRYRSIYEESALRQPEVADLARACGELGQEIRVCGHLPVKMHAFDGKKALLSLQDPVGGTPSFTAIITHHVGMVEALNLAFETLWSTAQEYAPGRKSS